MHLPLELQQAIESLTEASSFKSLKQGRESVSAEYREGASSRRAFGDQDQLLSYLVTRFPATYGVCSKVFQEIATRLPDFQCKRLLDLGSGPGSASWAAVDAFSSLSKLYLIEREQSAIKVGKRLGEVGGAIWEQAEWSQQSLDQEILFPSADLAVFSYVLGELSLPNCKKIVSTIWKSSVQVLVMIEPGTPRGHERILSLRNHMLAEGAQIVAPCPHQQSCPMSGSDWCHFPARIERSRLHRQLKGGTLGYEDEKYSYLVASKVNSFPFTGRVVHQPFKGSGHVKLPLCLSNGQLSEVTVTKRDKDAYRLARDAEWGSSWL